MILDGRVLAGCLRDYPDAREAFAAYEAVACGWTACRGSLLRHGFDLR